MQANNRSPQQKLPIPVIDLTDDTDEDNELDLSSSQPLEMTPKFVLQDSTSTIGGASPPKAPTTSKNDVNLVSVVETSAQKTMATSDVEIIINCNKVSDISAAETTAAITTGTGNEMVSVESAYYMTNNGETETVSGDDDQQTTYDSDTANYTRHTTTDVNVTNDTTMLMENTPEDMDMQDTPVDTNTTDDTTMDMDDSNPITETSYQSYSLYHYDWSNSTSFTCLASTHDRYNITTSQSLALDQGILNKPMNSSLSNRNKSHINNFFKACYWSPDGTCLLTSSEDRMIRLFDIPSSIYDPSPSEPVTLTPSLGILEGESICDIAWFPSMNSQDPTTCCFLSSTRDHPVRLWDATTGKVRASYCVVDHQERFIGPNVLKFNLDGTKIYCGYENMIEIFDVHAPGNNTSTKHSTTPHRKSRKGQKGIISCLDFNPDQSGMYAAGSYSQSIGIYDERTNDLCLKLTGMKGGGLTQVKFSVDGNLLYSASRQSNTISCWDVRQSGNILYELDRKGKTNQRITFDLDPTGSVLITGDQNGHVLSYDLTTMENEDVEAKPRLLSSWDAHEDIVSGATFNPAYPSVMATCSGQRKFEIEQSDDDDGSEDMVVDNTLKVWQLSGHYEWYSMDVGAATEQMELSATQ